MRSHKPIDMNIYSSLQISPALPHRFMSESIEKKIHAITLNIRAQRMHKNYTQEYLAYKLGISQNAYSKIELGLTSVSIKKLFIIAETLDVSIYELIGE